eukprot:2414588-Pyramimonas_sp.AAC.1
MCHAVAPGCPRCARSRCAPPASCPDCRSPGTPSRRARTRTCRAYQHSQPHSQRASGQWEYTPHAPRGQWEYTRTADGLS